MTPSPRRARPTTFPLPVRWFSLLLGAASTGASAPTPGLEASQWQLFIDDHAVARATGFDRVVHHPRWRGVVIDADQPWETSGVRPAFVGRAPDGTFLAYYTAQWWMPDTDARSANHSQVVYADGTWRTRVPDPRPRDRAQQYVETDAFAMSRDGIRWEKPRLGLVDAPTGIDRETHAPFPSPTGSGRDNNLGAPAVLADLGQYGQVRDPSRRYAVSFEGHAYFAAELPDPARDAAWRTKLTKVDGRFSPRGGTLSFWDPQHQEWVAMVQNATTRWLPSRQIARFTSSDLKVWRSEVALVPDSADPHRPDHYAEPMMLFPYASDGVVFGILSWLHSDRTTPDGGPVLDPASPAMQGRTQGWPFPLSEQNPFVWPWARKGPNELRITLSRDGGRSWDRTSSREAWIPHGTEEDSLDRMVIWSTPPVQVGDEDWFYVGVHDGDHLSIRANRDMDTYYHDRLRRGRIALYTQKHHRYVSLRSGTQRETLITQPFVVDGDELVLNVDGSRGRVRVGIYEDRPVPTLKDTTLSTDPHLMEQNVLAGFTLRDCAPIKVNAIEHPVRFTGGTRLDTLRGKRVRLFVEMVEADLYGFKLR